MKREDVVRDHAVREAVAVFDKSAERTRPNEQTAAWATLRPVLVAWLDAPEVVVEVMDERTHGYQCNAVNADVLEVGASARLVVIPDKD